MKKVCIVGYGAIGPIHAAAIEKTDNARLWAICDNVQKKLDICKEKYDVVCYSDFEEMLLDKEIDSVHICTPHYLHFEMIKKALAAGKSVVCEKPVTMTKAEFEELLSLEGADKVCSVFQNRLNPCFVRLKQIADSGELGKVLSVKAIVTWCRTAEYYAADEWRGKWATEGGGVLINQAVHTLDYLCCIGGRSVSVKADMMNYSLPEIEVEDNCVARVLFEGGAAGIFFASNSNGANSPLDFEVVFEKGIARYTDAKLYVDKKLEEEDFKPTIGKDYWGRGHETLVRNYYDLNQYLSPFDVKNTMNTMFAMYESAKQNGSEINI